jgi:CDP-6-deoxy-D-xylo-4-hexulose-3-dehydrase
MYNWPLANNNFTFWDRLKVCWFFLNKKNRWTQDKYVRQFERVAAKYTDNEYAVFVSSGSAANQLIAQYRKEQLQKSGDWPRKNKVIVSAVTWQTNVSVWVQLGFEPIFVDVNLDDFCFDYVALENILRSRKDIAAVFPTAVLGFAPDISKLDVIFERYNVPIYMDCCENSESYVNGENLTKFFTSTTSCFVAHQWSNGMEGGFIFTNNEDEYKYFILARAHGLLRNLKQYGYEEKGNGLVHPQFDFQVLSSNFRNTEIGAFLGILDSKKWIKHKRIRRKIASAFASRLNSSYLFPAIVNIDNENYPFCLPIICRNAEQLWKVKNLLLDLGIEYRPFISGNMLRQLPYQQYGNYKDYPNAEFLNNNAVYIGLNYDLTVKQVEDLAQKLNNL